MNRTTIYMSKQTREKVELMIDAGHSNTITGIIEIAIDRMYQEEARHKKLEVKPERKPWAGVRK